TMGRLVGHGKQRFTVNRVLLGAVVTPNHDPCTTVEETLTATHGNGAVEQLRHHGRSGAYADPELTCPVLSPVKVAAAEAYDRAAPSPSQPKPKALHRSK